MCAFFLRAPQNAAFKPNQNQRGNQRPNPTKTKTRRFSFVGSPPSPQPAERQTHATLEAKTSRGSSLPLPIFLSGFIPPICVCAVWGLDPPPPPPPPPPLPPSPPSHSKQPPKDGHLHRGSVAVPAHRAPRGPQPRVRKTGWKLPVADWMETPNGWLTVAAWRFRSACVHGRPHGPRLKFRPTEGRALQRNRHGAT